MPIDKAATQTLDDLYAQEAANSLTLNVLSYDIRYRLSELTGAEFKVWMAHLSHANVSHKRSFPRIETLAQETGLSEHGVKIAHQGLVRKGWLKRIRLLNATSRRYVTSSSFCQWPPPVPDSLYERVQKRKAITY